MVIIVMKMSKMIDCKDNGGDAIGCDDDSNNDNDDDGDKHGQDQMIMMVIIVIKIVISHIMSVVLSILLVMNIDPRSITSMSCPGSRVYVVIVNNV